MRLLADLHTHTVASGHAYSTVTENMAAAAARGLQLVAVTDHGPSLTGAPDPQYFSNLRVLPREVGGVALLTGVEANPADTDSGLDLPDRILSVLDIVGVALHPVAGRAADDAAGNTAAIVRALANPLVDVMTHPGRSPFAFDIERVVEAAVTAGVAVEVNAHSFGCVRVGEPHDLELAFLGAALDAGLAVSIASDAHFSGDVGRFSAALVVAGELGVAEERIVSRDAASVREFLLARRERPHMQGRWEE
jgi:putative hydrolase